MATILVIDDEPIVRAYLRHVLESDGHLVAEAADEAAGLEWLRYWPADLVFCEWHAPNLDGLELLSGFRREHSATKVIAMKAGALHREPGSLRVARWSGAVATLSKPFGPLEALAAVDLALGLHRSAVRPPTAKRP